jgi:hypothetical protein
MKFGKLTLNRFATQAVACKDWLTRNKVDRCVGGRSCQVAMYWTTATTAELTMALDFREEALPQVSGIHQFPV